MSRVVQSIRFDKNIFSLKEASNILKQLDIKPIKKVDETKNQYRFRIIEPSFFNSKTFITIKDDEVNGLSYIVGFLKKKFKYLLNTT
jgi:hypothetical protein